MCCGNLYVPVLKAVSMCGAVDRRGHRPIKAIATQIMHIEMSKIKCREIYMLAINIGILLIQVNFLIPNAFCNKSISLFCLLRRAFRCAALSHY